MVNLYLWPITAYADGYGGVGRTDHRDLPRALHLPGAFFFSRPNGTGVSNRKRIKGKIKRLYVNHGSNLAVSRSGSRMYRIVGKSGSMPLAEPIKRGLQGGYWGTCLNCIRPTDTALAFRGEPEWIIAGLHMLGLSVEDAKEVFLMLPGSATLTESGRQEMHVRVCCQCVRRSRAAFPDPVLLQPGGQLPCIVQP